MTVLKWIFYFLMFLIIGAVVLSILRFVFVLGMIDYFKSMPCCEGAPETMSIIRNFYG